MMPLRRNPDGTGLSGRSALSLGLPIGAPQRGGGALWGSDRERVHMRPQRQRSASRAGVASTRYARGVLLRPARSPCYWLRLASRISSRKASVATTRGLFRGSLVSFPTKESFGEKGYDVQNRVILDSLTSGNVV